MAVPRVHQGHHGCCSPTPTCSAWSGIVLIALPALLPTSISGVAGYRRQDPDRHRRASQHPAGGVRQAAARRVLRQLPGGQRHEVCRCSPGSGGSASPAAAAATSAPICVGLGAQPCCCWSSRATSAPARCSWACSWRCSTSRLADLVAAPRVPAVRRRRVRRRRAVCRTCTPRFSVWLHPFSSAEPARRHPALLPARPGPVRDGATAACSARGSATASRTGPRWCRATSSSPRFGEELGLAGVMALLLLYGLFVQRGLRTAIWSRTTTPSCSPAGLSFMFALQVFVIVGGVTRLIPLTGITTPFLSQGGSSLDRELAARRGARPAERHRAPPGAAADPGRGDDSGGVAPMTGMNRAAQADLHRRPRDVRDPARQRELPAGVQAPSLANRPLNDRAVYEQNQVQRGNIVTADGVTIATTKPSNDLYKYQRTYADGAGLRAGHRLRHHLHQSQAPNYATGVEQAENALLTGTGSQLAFRNFIDMITNKPQKGATVQVTINSKAQQAAYQQLQSDPAGQDHQRQQQVGGVVALNPSHRRDPGHGLLPELRPEPARHARQHRSSTRTTASCSAQKPEPAAEQRHPDHPAARLDVQDRHQLRVVHAGRDAEPEHVIDSPQPLTAAATGNLLNNDNNEQCGNGSGQTHGPRARSPSPATPRSPSSASSSAARRIKSMADALRPEQPAALGIPGVTVAPPTSPRSPTSRSPPSTRSGSTTPR